jgi:hypothetical protein
MRAPMRGGMMGQEGGAMTLLWFVVWLIWDLVGDREPLLFDPVNWWTGLLLAAIALDLSGHHASSRGGRRAA